MIPTLTQIQTWFDQFNTQVFNGELPRVRISFTNTRRQLGQFYWGRGRGEGIKISLFWDRTEDQYRNTVLHEMCHLYCYMQGWMREGHGPRWKSIARHATEVTGLKIQRCEDITGWEVASGNEAKMEAVKAKKNAPALLVDLEYDTYHFVVKVSKNTLIKSCNSHWGLDTRAKHYRILASDNPRFIKYQTSRSLHRGYRYENWEYDKKIKPLLEKAIEVDSIHDLWRGEYDCLGIR